jgi:cardiolipin synthase
MLHAKTAVIDGLWTTVGSSNLDRLSLYSNLELNVVVLDEDFGSAMNRVFRSDLENCISISQEKYKRSLTRFIVEWIAYRFRNIL